MRALLMTARLPGWAWQQRRTPVSRPGTRAAGPARPEPDPTVGGNQVASSPHGRDRDVGRGRIPRNRARILFVLTVVVILVVIFGYMLVVSQVGND